MVSNGCPPEASSGLPDTGQTTCFSPFNNELIDCAIDACAGQDGLYQTGCPSEGRFIGAYQGAKP